MPAAINSSLRGGIGWLKVGDQGNTNEQSKAASPAKYFSGAHKAEWVHPGDLVLGTSPQLSGDHLPKEENVHR